MKRTVFSLLLILCVQSTAFATWSVIALDRSTGQVIIASATCVRQSRFPNRPSRDLMDIQAVLVPGVGVAACQAGVDNTRENQMIVYEELRKGTDPERILELLREHENRKEEPQMERRQFGIVDIEGRSAGFNGQSNNQASLFVPGQVGDDIFFQVQGNILFSDNVAYNAALAFTRAKGTLADRVMAAMEGADEVGGRQAMYVRRGTKTRCGLRRKDLPRCLHRDCRQGRQDGLLAQRWGLLRLHQRDR